MPARSGDCTSARKRASVSGVAAAAELARRALKVRSSILRLRYRFRGSVSIVDTLILLDQRFDSQRVGLAMSVTQDRVRPAAGLDFDVREDGARRDSHRRDVHDVD